MTDGLRIDVQDRELIGTLASAVRRVEHPSELMQLIGAALEQNINLRFITKTDPAGHKWLPLSPKTLARKNGRGSLLVLTGKMKELHVNAGDDFVEVGSAEVYASFHETGTRNMPRRQFLSDDFIAGTLGAQDQADVLEVVQRYLDGSFA